MRTCDLTLHLINSNCLKMLNVVYVPFMMRNIPLLSQMEINSATMTVNNKKLVLTKNISKLQLDLVNYHTKSIYTLKCIRFEVEKGAMLIDVGANLGNVDNKNGDGVEGLRRTLLETEYGRQKGNRSAIYGD